MGVAERSERLVVVLIAAGLTGLGVPYVMAAGLWLLAVLSTVTLAQRVLAVRQATAGGGDGCPDSKTG
jgi:CDP-diacylglycerol--glycerol-3-phosphate 3-phosphatidyltransferase